MANQKKKFAGLILIFIEVLILLHTSYSFKPYRTQPKRHQYLETTTDCRCEDDSACCSIVGETCPDVFDISMLDNRFGMQGMGGFYSKFVWARGLPVISSSLVPDEALLQHGAVVNRMLAFRPELGYYLGDVGWVVAIKAAYPLEKTTDIPQYMHLLEGEWDEDWDERARGLGGTCQDLTSSAATENIMCYHDDRYAGQCIGVHEFAHTLHLYAMAHLLPELFQRVRLAFASRNMEVYNETYASTNENEYFAQGSQAWFGCGGDDGLPGASLLTRRSLEEADPALHAIMSDVYGPQEWTPACPIGDDNSFVVLNCSDYWSTSVTPAQSNDCALPAGQRNTSLHPWVDYGCPCYSRWLTCSASDPQSHSGEGPCPGGHGGDCACAHSNTQETMTPLDTALACWHDGNQCRTKPRCQCRNEYYCFDWHEHCGYWEQIGECVTSRDYMRESCPFSCQRCYYSETSTGPTASPTMKYGPTASPSSQPTSVPPFTYPPTISPSFGPTRTPTMPLTRAPVESPTSVLTESPSHSSFSNPTFSPTNSFSSHPTSSILETTDAVDLGFITTSQISGSVVKNRIEPRRILIFGTFGLFIHFVSPMDI